MVLTQEQMDEIGKEVCSLWESNKLHSSVVRDLIAEIARLRAEKTWSQAMDEFKAVLERKIDSM
jgi:hypothetical protein